jgi:hypothetical protein
MLKGPLSQVYVRGVYSQEAEQVEVMTRSEKAKGDCRLKVTTEQTNSKTECNCKLKVTRSKRRADEATKCAKKERATNPDGALDFVKSRDAHKLANEMAQQRCS